MIEVLEKVSKVYFFGTNDGKTVKIGSTKDPLSVRKKSLMSGQFSTFTLHLLAAVRGTKTHEKDIKSHFSHLKDDFNSTETFWAKPELVEYINWLRQQWWTYLEEEEHVDEIPEWPMWMPGNGRRVPFIEEDPYDLIPRNVTYFGPLAGTLWNKMSTPQPKIGDDFYTPPELIDAAREAMGNVDLDAASHWLANRVHKIPDYFHLSRRAEDNTWHGRVWLNPPYGENAIWFEQIKKYCDSGDIEQICMLSPVWAFTTIQARPIMKRTKAMILFCPTPKFWGNPNGRGGTNHPHSVIYIGERVAEFHRAFGKYGVSCSLEFDK